MISFCWACQVWRFVGISLMNAVNSEVRLAGLDLRGKRGGYRGITGFDATGKPRLWSRNGLPLEKKFPPIAKALSKLKLRSTILDGEVVTVDKNGIPACALSALATGFSIFLRELF
jgi:hypothetical protein